MFTYTVQLAGYPYEKVDEKGETEFTDFIQVFDTFPWLEQADSYDEIKEGCSATISVKAVEDDIDFWVSIAGNREKHIFLVGIVYLKLKKGWLGKEKAVKWLDIYEAADRDKIKSLFRLFFNKQFDQLIAELSTLKMFHSMKSYVR